jgi:hypothetical protein
MPVFASGVRLRAHVVAIGPIANSRPPCRGSLLISSKFRFAVEWHCEQCAGPCTRYFPRAMTSGSFDAASFGYGVSGR